MKKSGEGQEFVVGRWQPWNLESVPITLLWVHVLLESETVTKFMHIYK